MSVRKFCTLTKNSIKFESWVLPYVDIGHYTFLGDCEVLAVLMNGYTANTISVLAIKRLKLFGGEVVGLVLVTNEKNDDIVLQKVDIVAFKRLLAHHSVEANVSAADEAVFNWLFDVIAGIKFISRLSEHVFRFLFL